jgi:hypothetical protein
MEQSPKSSRGRRGGGRQVCAHHKTLRTVRGAENFVSKNKPTKLSKAKVKRITDRRIGRNAELEKLTSEELCQDLANKAVRRIISRRKRWRPRRASDCHYSELATKLCFLPSPSLEKLCSTLDDLMREYILARLDNDHDRFVLSPDLLDLLAKEYIRDGTTLRVFLSDVLKRRRTISASDSLHRVRLVTQQIASRYGHAESAHERSRSCNPDRYRQSYEDASPDIGRSRLFLIANQCRLETPL